MPVTESTPIDAVLVAASGAAGQARAAAENTGLAPWLRELLGELADVTEALAGYIGQPNLVVLEHDQVVVEKDSCEADSPSGLQCWGDYGHERADDPADREHYTGSERWTD